MKNRKRLSLLGAAVFLLLLYVCHTAINSPEEKATGVALQGKFPLLDGQLLSERRGGNGPMFARVSSDRSGIDFVYQPIPPEKQDQLIYSSSTAGGVCIGDYDGDGLADVFLTQPFGPDRLYRNVGGFRFEDVTERAGIDNGNMWSMGATFFDVDNDGDLDLYICGYDCPNRLYINQGEGTFVERAAQFGLDFHGASIMLAVADYDRDGDLDGFLVTNRLATKGPRKFSLIREDGEWTVEESVRERKDVLVRPGVGVIPINAGQYDHLFRNNGDGTFTDVSQSAGIDGNHEGLSATWSDFDGDGYPDLYVANDNFGPDQLWINNRDGTFTEKSKEFLPHTPWTSMGCDAADINNDGRFDLLASDMSATTHYKSKVTMGDMDKLGWFLEFPKPRQYMRNAVYLNSGAGRFMEVAHMTGLAATDWTWSVRFADLDNDGKVDVFVTNGMTRDFNNTDLMKQASSVSGGPPLVPESIPFWSQLPKRTEKNLAFRNLGDLTFQRMEDTWGLGESTVSFGCVTADLDNDGDLDMIVNNFEDAPSVYENQNTSGHAVRIQLRGRQSNRFGVGATIAVETASGSQAQYVNIASGFMSTGEPVAHFGLGPNDTVSKLSVNWPSGRVQTFRRLPADRLYALTEIDEAATPVATSKRKVPRFRPSAALNSVVHRETEYDDFEQQPLLPNKLSQFGPGMAWGDVNGDGRDDLFVGGAKGQAGKILVNQGSGRFAAITCRALVEDNSSEDMGALFFDADSDGDLDLYVVSGGVECQPGDPELRDRLYLNDGKSSFTRAPAQSLPDVRDSGSVVAACDFDADGDLDLFVGSRSIPGEYPLTPDSRLLRNEKGQFRDVADIIAPGLRKTGLVTSAIWSDVDDDGWLDLLVTHEWGPIKLYGNDSGKRLVDDSAQAGLSNGTGWWNGISARDVDNDGDIDYAVTNFGLNTKYHPTPEHPVRIYYGDFDNTGKRHIIESKLKDEWLPVRGKSCSQNAMPFIRRKFPTYHEFAIQGLEDIYTPQCLAEATTVEATTLESALLINDGHGRFSPRALPRLAQASPGFGVVLEDIDADGNCDLYLVQNFFGPQRETGRMDGGVSLLLMGEGTGDFVPVWPDKSGLVVPQDAKSLTSVDLNGDGWMDFVVGTNNGPMVAFENLGHEENRVVRVRLRGRHGNLRAAGARVTVQTKDGDTQTVEVASGGSYLSQSSATLAFGLGKSDEVESIKIRWPDGKTSKVSPNPEQNLVTIPERR